MFVKVNGINMHYEVFGEGKPIILIHGNGESYKIFDRLIEKLEKDYKVYAIDSRCHGESEDSEEITYELMTEDTIAFIKALKIEKPILYGFSDGGIIGLMVAIKEPQILSKLIISGAQLNPQGGKLYTVLLDKIAESIPNSTLYIVPKENHGSYIVHNDKIYDIIKNYLLI